MILILIIAAAYILLGAAHLAAPTKAPSIYRHLIGRRLYKNNAPRFQQVTSTNWKLMGAIYILFGMALVWSLRSSF